MDRCLICHRKLKDENSRQRGMGPTCWHRVMKVVKEDKERKKARRASRKKINAGVKGQITFFDYENGGEMSNDLNENK